ncbi:MAG: tripartite tricarboxylate transporter substrate binding protein [Rubritepida sp.]|nr:tripartite tricarboxylate transporter substrate binding protein [Rubritepida sp.]
MITRRSAIAAIATPALAQPALAQPAWPAQAVRYINPYPPGGPTDTLSRRLCQKLSGLSGQPFLVENRSGAGGNVGVDAIAKSRPDGYTIGLGGIASHGVAPTMYATLPFDVTRDFTYVSGMWQLPNLLAVNLDLPVHSVAELLEYARARPGQLTFGSAGPGTTLHLAGEVFNLLGQVRLVHVPYRGSAPAQLDLLAGRVSMMFDNIPGTLTLARQGRVRPLGVTSLARNDTAPEIPAIAETLPGFDVVSWTCLIGPAGIAPGIVARLSELMRAALAAPDLRASYFELAATPWFTTPDEMVTYQARSVATLAPVVRAAGLRAD